LLAELQGDEIAVPPEIAAEVERKLRAGICLGCGQPIAKGERVTRGLDASCRYQVKQLINSDKTSEAALILAGKMTAKPSQGGRKPKRLGNLLEGVPTKETAILKDITGQKKGRQKPKST
jgi:hypothetical protein